MFFFSSFFFGQARGTNTRVGRTFRTGFLIYSSIDVTIELHILYAMTILS